MMRHIYLDEPLAGCAVAYCNDTSIEVVLRCECGYTFPVRKDVALAEKGQLRCPECTGPVAPVIPSAVVVPQPNSRGPIRDRPLTGTASDKLHQMMTAGMYYYDAAASLGVPSQTAEKVFFRYTLPAQLRKRIADLEAELNTLKGAKS